MIELNSIKIGIYVILCKSLNKESKELTSGIVCAVSSFSISIILNSCVIVFVMVFLKVSISVIEIISSIVGIMGIFLGYTIGKKIDKIYFQNDVDTLQNALLNANFSKKTQNLEIIY